MKFLFTFFLIATIAFCSCKRSGTKVYPYHLKLAASVDVVDYCSGLPVVDGEVALFIYYTNADKKVTTSSGDTNLINGNAYKIYKTDASGHVEISIDDMLYFSNPSVHFDSAFVSYRHPQMEYGYFYYAEAREYRKPLDFNTSTLVHFIVSKTISFTNCHVVNIDANVNSIYYANPIYVVAIPDSVIKSNNYFKPKSATDYAGTFYFLDNDMTIYNLPQDKWYYYEYQKYIGSVLTTMKDTFYQGCTQRVITL